MYVKQAFWSSKLAKSFATGISGQRPVGGNKVAGESMV